MSEAVEQLTATRKLALEETHRRRGATFAERDGWMMPATYGDTRAEYEAVRGSSGAAGLIDFSARGRIEVGGAEAVQFLNGLITNDVKTLAAGTWMHAAFPNVQGRLLASVRVARAGEEVSFLIDTEPATHEKVFQTLQRFTLAGDFRVIDVSAETVQLSLQGAGARAILESVLGNAHAQIGDQRQQQQSAFYVSWREAHPLTILRATHTGEDGYDLICDARHATVLWEALVGAGAHACGFDAFEVLRVEAGEPRHGVDVTDANVVLEAGREEEAVSYTKGCYIGQEIIARIHWRGHVAKRLAGLMLEGDMELDDATTAIDGARVRSADGKEIGRVTSSVFSPRLGRRIALCILKYDYLEPDTQVLVVSGEVEGAARVASLPFVRGSWYDDATTTASDASGESEAGA
ncbi:MAG TPA: aminomethyltransferase family protein [Pyrinomonadaceae bacterium]|nr:aminomethyltransferase family protein [Pyrinomonadaceae bacterium]